MLDEEGGCKCDSDNHFTLEPSSLICVCSSGYAFADDAMSVCDTCDTFMPGCLTCDDSSVCTSCDYSENFLLNDTLCICTAGFGLEATVCVECPQLIPGCRRCSDSSTCTECDTTGHRIESSSCSCIVGYYQDTDLSCKPCSESLQNCVLCSNDSICNDCSLPAILVSGTCANVPSGGGIAIPAIVTTGRNKCSLAQPITLSYQPTSDLTLTITVPTAGLNYFNGFITIDGEVKKTVKFDSGKSSAIFSVCSYNATTAGVYSFPLTLSGTNASSYNLSNPTLNVSVQDMITLVFPSMITVPKSGCSDVQHIDGIN